MKKQSERKLIFSVTKQGLVEFYKVFIKKAMIKWNLTEDQAIRLALLDAQLMDTVYGDNQVEILKEHFKDEYEKEIT